MLYTTYASKMVTIPDNAIKLVITRFPPKWLQQQINSTPNTYLSKSLSPSEELLMRYKRGGSWDSFKDGFNKELKSRPDLIEGITRLKRLLDKGQDVFIICAEKDHLECHRYLIALNLQNEGYSWQEWLG